MKRHKINLSSHIKEVSEIGVRLGQGITFKAVDSDALKAKLKMPAFAHDNRHNIFERAAAMATTGEGFREIGVPSLHFAISPSKCSVHLDSFGFVAIGPDGIKYYHPDLFQHIVDELGWAALIQWLDKKEPNVAQILGRIHPILPSSRNLYNPSIGAKFVLIQGGRSSLGLDHTISISGERKTLVSVDIWNW